MDHRWRCLAVAFAVLVSVAALAGCSSEPKTGRWTEVASGRFTGRTERIDLGNVRLTSAVAVRWDLNGASDARAEFRLKVASVSDPASWGPLVTRLRSWKDHFELQAPEALAAGVPNTGEYHVTLTQRVPKDHGAGYSGSFTLVSWEPD